MNIKALYLMSEVDKIRFLVQQGPCNSQCGLNKTVSNSKQKWDHNGCRCECK